MAIDITTLAIEVKSSGIKEASSQLGGLSTSAVNTERRITSLIETMKKLQTVSSTFTITASSTAALTAALTALNGTLTLLNQRTQQVDTTQRRHNESMREAHALSRGLAGSFNALWMTYGQFAGMAVGLAIGTSLKGIVAVGKDVEHTLEAIRVRGMETVAAVNEMRTSIQDLGKGVYGPQEVANAFEVLILAGLRADQALVGIKDALNLATVGGTSIEKAATVLVQVSTALGFTAEGFGRISDVIAKTAAVSISSVDGISESFKTASVVGKLYGQSLVDLGTQFAILSNLGIKNTAAGTASKNFFSDLASGSEKVTKGLAMLKLSIKDLKDEQGNFKSFNEVMRTLAGDGEKGFNSLTAANQKFVQSLITNERGNKLMTEGLDLIRKKGKETATELDDISKRINESWGFTAQGAAAMALTVESQFKSVKNTLQTVLGQAFVEIQPQLSLVATSLKKAFNSPEFTTGIQSLAVGVANLSVFLIENAGTVWEVVRALLAFKAAAMVVGLLTGIAEAFILVKTAMDLAKISAIAFQASLGLVGVALAAGAALLVWWSTKRDEAFNSSSQKAALNYMDDFKNKLEEENQRLEKQIDLMNKGKTATDAYTESQQKMQLQKVRMQGADAISEAEARMHKLRAGFNQNQRDGIAKWEGGDTNINHYDGQQITALKQLTEATKSYLQIKDQVAAKDKATEDALEKNIKLSKQAADLSEEAAKARGVIPSGEGELPPKVDKAQESDALQAALKGIQNQIKIAKIDADEAKKAAQSEYKRGMIGEIDLIERTRQAELNKQIAIAESAAGRLKVMRGVAGQEAAYETAIGEIAAANEATKAANSAAENSRAELEVTTKKKTLEFEVEKFKALGQYRKAYDAEFKAENAVNLKRLESNIAKETDEVKRGELEKLKAYMAAAQTAGEVKADNLDAVASFNVAAEATRNALKGIQTASEGQGLDKMFDAATAASKKYAESLPDLKDKMSVITDKKATNEAQAELTKLAETQKKMWAGVAESISTSLESAFGKGGKAVGELIKIGVNYGNLENKTGAARIKAFGDAAGAAKGFFKEGTTGYKVMETAEKAFRLIELAGMAKSLALTISTAAAKAAAWVPAVMMSFMASMGPWGLAAAGVAIAAVLGGAFGGGGSGSAPMSAADRQKQAGTGSVLGDKDAKSESIANSLEIMQKNSGLGLVHSGSMVKSLRIIESSLGNLSSLVVRTAGIKDGSVPGVTEGTKRTALGNPILGGPFAMILDKIPVVGALMTKLFGSTTSIKDQGIKINRNSLAGIDSVGVNAQSYADIETKKKALGITYSNKPSTQFGTLPQEIGDQFTLVVKSLADGVTAAATTLGLGGDAFTAKLKTFVVDIGSISIKGLSADEIQKQFDAVFSKLGDDMAKFAVDGLGGFQKVGEGSFETLARLSNQLIQVKDVFSVLGKTFDATGMNAVKISDDLVKAVGGLDKLTEGTKYYVENFFNEAERMKPISDSVTKRLSELSASELTTIDLYKAKIQSLDLTNAADQELYANLLELAPAFKEVADYSTKLAEGTEILTKAQQKALDIANKQRELDIRLMEAQGDTIQAVAERRKDELAALTKLSPALAATQKAIYDAEDAAAKLATKRSLEVKLMDAQGDSVGALGARRNDELAALNKLSPALAETQMALYGVEDAAANIATKRSLETRLIEATGDAAGSLARKRADETAALKKTNPELVGYLTSLYGIEDATKASTAALNAEKEAKERLSKYTTARDGLDIRMAEAVGNTAQATALKRKAEIAAMNEVSPALGAYLERVYEAEDANVKAKDNTEKLTDAKDALNDAYERESSALNSVIDKFKGFSDSLKEFKRNLLGGDLSTLSPEQKYLKSKEDFNNTAAKAAMGDEGAIGQLQTMSQDFLDASRGYYASTTEYVKDFDLVQVALDKTISAADQQVSAAQAQLAIMNAQASSLVQIKDGVLSFSEALKAYTKADEDAKTTELKKDVVDVPTGDSNYIGWYENVHKPTVKAAADAKDREELTAMTKQLVAVMGVMSEALIAANGQRSAIAEEQAKQAELLTAKIAELNRKIAAQGDNKK